MREAERAFNVLAELAVRPLLREADIARERDIIVEEIRSYRDDPGQYVFNLFDRAFFGDTPLGWEIAGDEASVRGLPDDRHPRLLVATYRPAQPGRLPWPATSTTTTLVEHVSATFGTGNADRARVRRRARLRRASA